MMAILILLIVTTCLLMAGILRHDIISSNRQRARKLHPYAKAWRTVPRISIATTTPVMIHNYRKQERFTHPSDATSEFILQAKKPTILSHDQILEAVYELHTSRKNSVEIFPQLTPAASLSGTIYNYRELLTEPFGLARKGFEVNSSPYASVRLTRRQPLASPARRLYTIFYDMTSMITGFLFYCFIIYSLILAGYYHQPLLFEFVLVSYVTFTVYALLTTRRLTWVSRISYLFLLPVTILPSIFYWTSYVPRFTTKRKAGTA